jgi:hypothetical protein
MEDKLKALKQELSDTQETMKDQSVMADAELAALLNADLDRISKQIKELEDAEKVTPAASEKIQDVVKDLKEKIANTELDEEGEGEKKKVKKPRSEKQIAAMQRMAKNPSQKQIAARANFKAKAADYSAKANAAKASGEDKSKKTAGKKGRPFGSKKKVVAVAVKKVAKVKKIDYDTASPKMKQSIDRCRALLKAVKQKRATAKKYRDERKKEGKPAEMQVAEVLDAAASKVEAKIDRQIKRGRFTTKTQAREISTDIKHIVEYVLKSMEKQADKKQFVDDLCTALKKAVK